MATISFLGAGYVGLITAVCFADRGFNVMVVDPDVARIESIRSGIPPFYEKRLKALLRGALASGRLRCGMDAAEAVQESKVSFITVGTPGRGDGKIDLRYVEKCAKDVGAALKDKAEHHLVVVKSTVVPGTTVGLVRRILETESCKTAGSGFCLCMNPEFLKEGEAINDTFNPDRIVIGGINAESTQALEEILREFHGDTFPPIIRTTPSTAEMIKYASNSFLAAKISLINEIANICELTPSVDVSVVAMGVGLDNRIGERFLKAGVGFGGSCFKKDVQALASYSESRGFEPMLLRGIIKVNEHQADHVVQLAEEALTSLAGRRVAVLGLSFKPDTDDVREAPSIRIIQGLLKTKANIVACDPKANLNAKAIFGNSIDFADSPEEALKDADCCILVTEWDEFKRLKPSDFVATMRNPIVIDGRRIYDKEEYRKVVKYIGIGLGPHESLGRFPGCRVEA